MTPIANISFPGQDQIQNEFLQYVQSSPFDDFSKDLILTHSNQLSPILLYPPLACFPHHQAGYAKRWKELSLCCAFSMLFISLYARGTPKNQNLYRLARILIVESQRICGSMFDLEQAFWKTFYHRIALQTDSQKTPEKYGDVPHFTAVEYFNLSIYLLPIDALSLLGSLSAFQNEMFEQSLLSMFKGFYNMENNSLADQKKLFKDAMIYAKDIPIDGYDHWINHNAHLIIRSKTQS